MVDEDSPDSDSADLSISGEEGHWTILLAYYISWFKLRTKLFSNAGYTAKKCLEILFLLHNLHILAQDQKKKVLFFRANFEQLSL